MELFRSRVPLIYVPTHEVTGEMRVTKETLNSRIRHKNEIGDFLYERVACTIDECGENERQIWDLGALSILLNPSMVKSHIIETTELNDSL